MKIEEALLCVEPKLTEKRFKHTLRVAKEAVNLAKIYKVDQHKAELAAVFHDYAKNRPLEEMKRIIQESYLPKDLLQYHHELWHGPVGAILIEREHGITDPDILHAIRYHTTGKVNMNMLDLVIYVADYIEPGRNFPGVAEVRQVAPKNIIYASFLIARNTIQYLMKSNSKIYPDSFYAYNHLTDRIANEATFI